MSDSFLILFLLSIYVDLCPVIPGHFRFHPTKYDYCRCSTSTHLLFTNATKHPTDRPNGPSDRPGGALVVGCPEASSDFLVVQHCDLQGLVESTWVRWGVLSFDLLSVEVS